MKHSRPRNVPKDPDGEARVVRRRSDMRAHRVAGGPRNNPNQPPQPPPVCALYDDLNDAALPAPVFGQYPRALIGKLLPYLKCDREEILHVCSGALNEGLRVDIRTDARPSVLADGRALPFASGFFKAVLLDPPYTPQYAKELYGVDYPRPSHLLREAARIAAPCGRIGFVHYLVPVPPPACRFVKAFGLSTGMGFPMRAVTIFEKEQDLLL